jgi:phage terminase small subunit
MALNEKKIEFCYQYILTKGNITESAKKAGYSKKTAYSIGSRLLKDVEVQKKIKAIGDRKLHSFDMDIEKAFALMVKHATYDTREIIENKQIKLEDKEGREYIEDHVSLKDWDDIDGTLISEIKQTKDGIQVKLPDRQKALEQIGRHFAMFTEKQQIDLQGELGVIVLPTKKPVGAPVSSKNGKSNSEK